MQRILTLGRALIGADLNFSDNVTCLWVAVGVYVSSKEIDPGNTLWLEVIRALARLTRNTAAGCPDNQIWISACVFSSCKLAVTNITLIP